MNTDKDFSQMMASWKAHEAGSDEKLFAYIYSELHKLANYHIHKESPGHTLQATALANEAYMRLSGGTRTQSDDQAHFCAVASR
ncbi:MAG TPA: ECF-type sigma factor, partial [Xanthomonadales bacterium]|nr:ECF-type sigma factor [Xanthomonadales bacterium]